MNRIKRKWRKWFAIPLAVVLVAGTVMGVQMTQPTPVLASGVTASNIALTGQVTDGDLATHYTFVQFDIGWENSWRDAENWDAAWIFVKYKESGGVWKHATLATSGHSAPSGSTIDATADGKGVFIYRDSVGTGAVSYEDVELKWLYGTDGLSDDAIVMVKVFAIEMVYIPEGSFVLDSGESDNLYANFNGGNTISSEDALDEGAITWDVTESQWSGAQDSSGNTGGSAALGASYPKGFQAFYVMKYEISQRQYAEFLNTLTEAQQKTLTGGNTDAEDRSAIPDAGCWAMSGAGNEAAVYRSYIKTESHTAGSPATFICDANVWGGEGGNKSNDGEWTACNFISWADGLAYADWAGLRPMTELEYEKACRGPGTAGDEYAWGDTTIFGTTDSGDGYTITPATENTASETVDNSITLGNAAWRGTVHSIFSLNGYDGPLRCGIFADADSDRREAGATYYGVMEMSGNVWERVVTVAKYCYDGTDWSHETGASAFDGQHGDGSLTAGGYADVTNWPSANATDHVNTAYGAGVRGGGWDGAEKDIRVSGRYSAAYPGASRGTNSLGFRLVRTP